LFQFAAAFASRRPVERGSLKKPHRSDPFLFAVAKTPRERLSAGIKAIFSQPWAMLRNRNVDRTQHLFA
jgi:hypothetical protein